MKRAYKKGLKDKEVISSEFHMTIKNKENQHMKYLQFIFSFLVLGIIMSCDPAVDDKIDIGDPPNPSFNIIQGDTPNDFTLMNTTDGAFITQWTIEGIGSESGETVDIYIPKKGTYEVSMTTFNRGGSGTSSKSLEVTESDQADCTGNLELLTNCDSKVWKLAPEANALNVGPSATETWWGNSEDDIEVRACHFNDEYIFTVDGDFIFDSKGDFWADSDSDGNVFPAELGIDVGCHEESAWPGSFAVWGSGTHSFNITATSLTVAGEGAWLGLYKIGTSGEVGTPQSSVTLSISEISDSRMVLLADYGGVVWRVTFVSE